MEKDQIATSPALCGLLAMTYNEAQPNYVIARPQAVAIWFSQQVIADTP